MTNKFEIKNFFNETVLIAVITILGYVAAWSYESGFLSTYEIPASLIPLDFKLFINASGVVLLVSVIALFFISILKHLSQTYKRFWNVFGRVIILIIFTLVLYVLTGVVDIYIWVPIGLIVLILIITFLLAIPKVKPHKTFFQRMLDLNINESSETKKSSLYFFSTFVIFPVTAFIVVIFMAHQIGKFQAKNQIAHVFLVDEPDMLVIATYEDTIILKKIDLSTKTATHEFSVRKITESMPMNAKNESKFGKIIFE